MITKTYIDYITPEADSVEILENSFLCQSGGTDGYHNTNDPEWFDSI